MPRPSTSGILAHVSSFAHVLLPVILPVTAMTFVALTSACGGGSSEPVDQDATTSTLDAGQTDHDGSTGEDAALPDAETADAQATDAETMDAEGADAGVDDASATDGGNEDASVTDSGTTTDGGESSDGGTITDAGESEDGGITGSPLDTLADCLGQERPIALSHSLPYFEVSVAQQTGMFLLDVGTNFSSIDLGAFATPPATRDCDPSQLGSSCTFDDFALFDAPFTVYLTLQDFSRIQGSVRQAGMIGTDFLSLKAMTFEWSHSRVFASEPGTFCPDGRLRSVGLEPLSTEGFYTNDFSNLKPLTEVIPDTTYPWTVPNIPTVPISVAGVAAIAQLDTGFDDSVVRFSLNINEAFLTAIESQAPGALIRDATLDLNLTTCVAGVTEQVTAYRLRAGESLGFTDMDGDTAASFDETVLFVKNPPDAAFVCGGIGTWKVPAAQVAISFLSHLDALIFDPFTSRVWVPGRQATKL